MKRINPSRMTFKLEFGHWGPTDEVNPNTGEAINGFITDFKAWAGEWSISRRESIELQGQSIRNARTYFIRHRKDDIPENALIRRGSNIYTINSITYDDGSRPPDGFDMITCHRKDD